MNIGADIQIMSREEIESDQRIFSKKTKYGIISISDHRDNDAIIEYKENFVFLEFVNFHNVDKVSHVYSLEKNEYEIYYPMSELQAEILASLVKNNWNKIDTLIVQSPTGISRSAGIASAVTRYYYNDDLWIFDSNKYRPNKHCYGLMYKWLKDESEK